LECGASRTPERDERDRTKSDGYEHDHVSIRAAGQNPGCQPISARAVEA
jgi:hypothetical protein